MYWQRKKRKKNINTMAQGLRKREIHKGWKTAINLLQNIMRSTKEGKFRRRDKCVNWKGNISKQKVIDANSTPTACKAQAGLVRKFTATFIHRAVLWSCSCSVFYQTRVRGRSSRINLNSVNAQTAELWFSRLMICKKQVNKNAWPESSLPTGWWQARSNCQ